MKYIALDPGGTTGIAVYDYANNNILVTEIGPQEHHKALMSFLNKERPDVLICESFQYRKKLDNANLIPNEYIGIAKLFCQITNTRLELQTPAQGKNFWTDAKIKALNLWAPGNRHAMDAVRHLLYFVTFREKDDTFVRLLRDAAS